MYYVIYYSCVTISTFEEKYNFVIKTLYTIIIIVHNFVHYENYNKNYYYYYEVFVHYNNSLLILCITISTFEEYL